MSYALDAMIANGAITVGDEGVSDQNQEVQEVQEAEEDHARNVDVFSISTKLLF